MIGVDISMKEIDELYDQINEEIDDAEKYARCALKKKETNQSLAETYFTLSNEELKHMSMLHGQVVALIEAYKKEEGKPPESMLALYNYAHRKAIDRVTKVKAMLAVYKEKE